MTPVANASIRFVSDDERELGSATSDEEGNFTLRISEGFRALCVLIEVGKGHYRTENLLRLTYHKGDEQYLIALAGMNLPNFGTWTALKGLGATDSKKARQYLQRLINDVALQLIEFRHTGHLTSAHPGHRAQ